MSERPHCHHCGEPPEADGDHTCSCPLSDSECLEHTLNPVPPPRAFRVDFVRHGLEDSVVFDTLADAHAFIDWGQFDGSAFIDAAVTEVIR